MHGDREARPTPCGTRSLADADAIQCPVLFLMQWDDEIFSRAACVDLFDQFGSNNKRLHVQPGAHASVPAEELDASEAFLANLAVSLTAPPRRGRAARATSVRRRAVAGGGDEHRRVRHHHIGEVVQPPEGVDHRRGRVIAHTGGAHDVAACRG